MNIKIVLIAVSHLLLTTHVLGSTAIVLPTLLKSKIILNFYFRTAEKWIDIFERCPKDTYSINIMRKYCGEVLDRIFPFEVRIKNVMSQYGTPNLYCKWRGMNLDNIQNLYLNITKYNYNTGDKYYIEINYYDGSYNFYDFSTRNFYVSSSAISSIILHFYTQNPSITLPFEAKFEIANDSIITNNYFSIFIVIGIVILACVVLSIFLHKCSKFFSKNNTNIRNNQINQNIFPIRIIANDMVIEHDEYIDHSFIREENRKQKNSLALDKLFSEELLIEKFSKKTNEICTNCTICLEDFQEETEVVSLVCKHTFHFSCLRNWLDRILLQPKCPNCNCNILPDEKNESDESSSEVESSESNEERNIQNNLRTEIINRSRLNRMNNNSIRRNVRDDAFTNLTSISIDNRSINNGLVVDNVNRYRNNRNNLDRRYNNNNFLMENSIIQNNSDNNRN